MDANTLIEGLGIIGKYIPINEISIWLADHYMIGITNKEGIKYSKEDLSKLVELGFMKTCACEDYKCDCVPEFWTKFF